VILADGSLGQMMEPAELPPMLPLKPRPEWALGGARGRERNVISSIYLDPLDEEAFNQKLVTRYKQIEQQEVRYHEVAMEDAEFAVIAFGTAGRVAQSAVSAARKSGLKVGLHRPISLYPFPSDRIRQIAQQVSAILVVEMNAGQMLDDVRLAVGERTEVHFYGRMGGVVPLPDEVLHAIREMGQEINATPAAKA